MTAVPKKKLTAAEYLAIERKAAFKSEFLNGEIFHTLLEAKILTEQWRRLYNTKRPHSSLEYRPPAPESIQPTIFRCAA